MKARSAPVRALLPIAIASLLVAAPACVSGGEGESGSDAGSTAGSGGAGNDGGGGTGGTSDAGGSGDSGGTGGSTPQPDAEPGLELPTGCAPSDMRFLCNPITNEGCDSGEACDYGLDDYFTCFPPPNDVDEGDACDMVQGPFCKAGMTCDTPTPDDTAGVCHRHCCSSDDCVAPQTCVTFDPEFGTLGVCN